MITDSNGVNVKSTASGKCLWKNFSRMDRTHTAANTGITWYVYGVWETCIPNSTHEWPAIKLGDVIIIPIIPPRNRLAPNRLAAEKPTRIGKKMNGADDIT